MGMLQMRFEGSLGEWFPVLDYRGPHALSLVVAAPIKCRYLRGHQYHARYQAVERIEAGHHQARHEWNDQGYTVAVQDEWQALNDQCIRLTRRIQFGPLGPELPRSNAADGIQLWFQLAVSSAASGGWRFFAPSQLYDPVVDRPRTGHHRSFMEDRLAYPLIMGYHAGTNLAVAISRAVPATVAYPPARRRGNREYTQQTDLGALGFSFDEHGGTALDLFWPYFEGETSVALDADLSPAAAFHPLDSGTHALTLSYDINVFDAAQYSSAAFEAFCRSAPVAERTDADLPFSLEDAIDYRIASLQKTYREWGSEGAAFFCSFDPAKGYGTPPSGFGTQFNTIPSDDYQRILEFGFTGRQLAAAYVLAERRGGVWLERGRRLVNFFVRHLTHPTGWLYSLYDVAEEQPLFSFSASRPALLHYGGYSQESGNFLRTMVESAADLLLNYQWHRRHATTQPHWLDTCRNFGHFLLRYQNADGSWFRAYGPEGQPILGDRWFGADERAARSATMIPIAFLVALGREDPQEGVAFLDAARRAGDYVLSHHVEADLYLGATLDNPNVIDKEAALYTMHALLALYEHFGEQAQLAGAERAGQLAVTWNYMWNPPFFPSSRLDRLAFKATGWGGINSIWGGGVVDIYSLFFLHDLVRLSRLTAQSIYRDFARLIAVGTQQLLSHPGNLLGYADIGMQPEGVGITGQGMDDGLITKGDTWGSLGWIYLAGTLGLEQYLDALHNQSQTG